MAQVYFKTVAVAALPAVFAAGTFPVQAADAPGAEDKKEPYAGVDLLEVFAGALLSVELSGGDRYQFPLSESRRAEQFPLEARGPVKNGPVAEWQTRMP